MCCFYYVEVYILLSGLRLTPGDKDNSPPILKVVLFSYSFSSIRFRQHAIKVCEDARHDRHIYVQTFSRAIYLIKGFYHSIGIQCVFPFSDGELFSVFCFIASPITMPNIADNAPNIRVIPALPIFLFIMICFLFIY